MFRYLSNTSRGYGDAKSLYFMASDKGNDGVDRTSCDTVLVEFRERKPYDIIWLGAIDGEYFPEKMVFDKVKDYFLPNYRWSDKRPIKRNLEFNR